MNYWNSISGSARQTTVLAMTQRRRSDLIHPTEYVNYGEIMIGVKDKESPILTIYRCPRCKGLRQNTFAACSLCGHHPSGNDPLVAVANVTETKIFVTGAVRSKDADGVRYDLITPIGLRRLAKRHQLGTDKGYADFNWERGMPVHDLLNHAVKHIMDFLEGDTVDPDNLAGAAWNLMAAMHSQEKWPELNEGHLRKPGCNPPLPPAVPAKPRHSTEV